MQYVTPGGTRGDRNIFNPGAGHLAFAVRDIAAEYRRLLARGIRFFSEPNKITEGVNTRGSAESFRGPDDIVHGLVQGSSSPRPGCSQK